MTIDVFCHVLPGKYVTAMQALVDRGRIPPFNDFFLGEIRVAGISDMDERFSLMDGSPETRQVLSLTGPFLETIAASDDAASLARMANDEVARLVDKYPDRFAAGVATLPLNNIEAALIEIDRAIDDLGLKGVQIGTDVNGRPLDSSEMMPLYEKMAARDLPVFVHPSRNRFGPDYPGEEDSKYNLFSVIGWPHSTSMAMLRLAHGGVLERFPGIKFITHHAGGTIPYLAKRIEGLDRGELPRPIGDYLRRFFGDTAVQGNTANLMCALAFFGADHLLFGTDFPFNRNISATLRAIDEMRVTDDERQLIWKGNATSLLKLPG